MHNLVTEKTITVSNSLMNWGLLYALNLEIFHPMYNVVMPFKGSYIRCILLSNNYTCAVDDNYEMLNS